MKIQQWNTIISECEELHFIELIDTGPSAIFKVKDNAGKHYEIFLENCGPYLIANEEYLTKYWNLKDNSIGWTFEVKDSPFMAVFTDELDIDRASHYVISTIDTCLEVISEYLPEVRAI